MLCAETRAANATDEEVALKLQRSCLDRLYGDLDLLDRKGASLVTVNSFLLAIIGVFLFRPVGLFEPTPPTGLLPLSPLRVANLVLGALANAAALFSIWRALAVFQIKWRYMIHATGAEFTRELDYLCEEAALRQQSVQTIRRTTLFAVGAVAFEILCTYIDVLTR